MPLKSQKCLQVPFNLIVFLSVSLCEYLTLCKFLARPQEKRKRCRSSVLFCRSPIFCQNVKPPWVNRRCFSIKPLYVWSSSSLYSQHLQNHVRINAHVIPQNSKIKIIMTNICVNAVITSEGKYKQTSNSCYYAC